MPSMLSYFLPLKIEWQYREIYEVLYKFINKHWTVNVYDGNVGSMNWLCYLMSALQPAHVPGAKWSLTLSFKPKIFPLPLSVSKFWLVILGRRRKKKERLCPLLPYNICVWCSELLITAKTLSIFTSHILSFLHGWMCCVWGGVEWGWGSCDCLSSYISFVDFDFPFLLSFLFFLNSLMSPAFAISAPIQIILIVLCTITNRGFILFLIKKKKFRIAFNKWNNCNVKLMNQKQISSY